MKTELLFEGELWYVTDGVWVYGDHEAAGYAEGEGVARGDRIAGLMRWSNRPARREDGTWLTDIRGYIQTDDGGSVLLESRGRTVPERMPGEARDVICSVTFRTTHERYTWLNDVVGLLEARLDPTSGRMNFRVFDCSNDLVAT